MTARRFRTTPALTLAAGLIAAMSTSAEEGSDALLKALERVNAQSPQDYPEQVAALPEPAALAAMDNAKLLPLLTDWNPAVRVTVAAELGRRGDSVAPQLREGTSSENWMVRAGAVSALTAILKEKFNKWQEAFPDVRNYREAHAMIREENADLGDIFTRLAGDPRLEVRVEALKGLSLLAPQTAEATLAVIELCKDDDEYLAQDAMAILQKQFGSQALQQEEVVVIALKEAMTSPLPRGRGSVVQLISQMDESTQRQFIPDLLAHLDWQPNRDTMFGAGGQQTAIEVLTKLEVKELLPRLPALMQKGMRGPGLFEPCLASAKAFGFDAKSILPALRTLLEEIEPTPADLRGRNAADLQKRHARLAETIDHIENL